MRVLRKEMKKILDLRLLVILALFSAVYTSMFLGVSQDGWNYSNSQYDVGFHKELVMEFGPELSLHEWDAFLEKRKAIVEKIAGEIKKNPVLQKRGVGTYEEFCHRKDSLYSLDNMEDSEKELYDEINHMIFADQTASPLFSGLQIMDNIIENREHSQILADEREFDATVAGSDFYRSGSDDFKKRYKEISTRESLSLIHDAVILMPNHDFVQILIICAVWCYVLVLPYQIGERLCEMRAMQLVTRKGRGVFGLQAGVSALTGAMIGAVMDGIYAGLLWRKGAFGFLGCDGNTIFTRFWTDISYLDYLLIFAAAIILFSVCVALTAYFIGRLAANYIAGIGMAIPTVAVMCGLCCVCCSNPLFMDNSSSFVGSVLRLCGAVILLVAVIVIVRVMLRNCRKITYPFCLSFSPIAPSKNHLHSPLCA